MWRLLLDLARPTGDDTTINANHIPARTADKKIIKKKGKTEQNQNKFLFVYIYWEAFYYKVVKSYRRLYDGAKGICKIQATLRSYIFVIFQQIRFNLGIFTKWFWQIFSPHVRESRTVLDSGFQSLIGFRIPSAGFRTSKPRIPDSTNKKKLPGFRNPDSLTWGEIFAKFSLSKAEKAMKRFILSKVFFWALVHF